MASPACAMIVIVDEWGRKFINREHVYPLKSEHIVPEELVLKPYCGHRQ